MLSTQSTKCHNVLTYRPKEIETQRHRDTEGTRAFHSVISVPLWLPAFSSGPVPGFSIERVAIKEELVRFWMSGLYCTLQYNTGKEKRR
jgi:hypothetical protein